MKEVQNILSNPLLKQGLKLVAPEIAIGIDLVVTAYNALLGGEKRIPYAKHLLALTTVIDKRLAVLLEDLATTKSKARRRRCEIRIHELLGILNEWEKIT